MEAPQIFIGFEASVVTQMKRLELHQNGIKLINILTFLTVLSK